MQPFKVSSSSYSESFSCREGGEVTGVMVRVRECERRETIETNDWNRG